MGTWEFPMTTAAEKNERKSPWQFIDHDTVLLTACKRNMALYRVAT